MRVAVLGCGPAGLLAAHGAKRLGHEVLVFSRREPSKIGGAQFLHRFIPGITPKDPDDTVWFEHQGTREGYAKKVYGDPNAPVSWDDYPPGPHAVWNLRRAYAKLWDMYVGDIVDQSVNADHVFDWQVVFDLIISTIPLRALCHRRQEHTFESQTVYIDYRERDYAGDDKIIYNGEPEIGWYRFSRLFGVVSYEFPYSRAETVRITKPLSTDCDCFPHVQKIGRYGAWQKRQLTHHAFERAQELLS